MGIIARRVINSDALINAGDFCWYSSGGEGVYNTMDGKLVPASEKLYAGIGFMCPCGCGREGALYTYLKGTEKTEAVGWEWDGNPDMPTLSPSIYRSKEKWPENCGWHGHMIAGVWQPC